MGTRQFLLTNLISLEEGGFKWRINLDGIEKALPELRNFPPTKHKSFNHNTLFIGGTQSNYIKEEHHSTIKTVFPHSKIEMVDAGHWVHAEKPDIFVNLVTEFFQK